MFSQCIAWKIFHLPHLLDYIFFWAVCTATSCWGKLQVSVGVCVARGLTVQSKTALYWHKADLLSLMMMMMKLTATGLLRSCRVNLTDFTHRQKIELKHWDRRDGNIMENWQWETLVYLLILRGTLKLSLSHLNNFTFKRFCGIKDFLRPDWLICYSVNILDLCLSLQALSQRDAPHRNFFFFDGLKGNGVVDYFGPK